METGTPYLLYKDSCNKKSNQKNLGTIKSSNLCTEIVEYSDDTETAVCNLASISLSAFVSKGEFNFQKLEEVVSVVTNNLNNIIDHKNYDIINGYIRDKTGYFYFEFYDDVKLVHLLINTKYFKKKENYSINLNKYFIEFYKVEDNKIFETNKYFSFELLKSTEFNRNMIEIFKFDISKIFFNLKKTYQKDNEVLLEDLIDLIKIISINQKKFISFINYNNLLFFKKIKDEIVLYDQIEDEYKLFITNNSLDEIKLNINDKINFNNF